MSAPRLSFEGIEIRRMPGFETGGLTVRDLSPGVNVIYGPNASGKTSLSRAMQCLLDSGRRVDDHVSLLGWLRQDGAVLTVECDLGRHRCQRDGRDVDCPLLVPAELGNRYVLALHHLIGTDDGADLAAEIVRQSAGGYDVASARENLGFRLATSTKGAGVYQDLRKADDACRSARRAQEELVHRQRQLEQLKEQRREASHAREGLDRLECAAQLLAARQRRVAAQQRVDDFPPGLAKMTGDELAKLQRLRESLDAKRGDRRQQSDRGQQAQAVLDACRLPAEGVPAELAASLRKKCTLLLDAAAQCREKSAEVQRLNRQRQEAIASLGSEELPADAPKFEAAAVQKLFDLVAQRQHLRAECDSAQTLRRWLTLDASQPHAASEPHDAQRLFEGWQLLGRWLAADSAAPVNRSLDRVVTVSFAVLLALLAVVMGLAFHWTWWLLLILSPAPLVWAFWRSRGSRQAGSQEDIHGQYESLALDAPRQWTKADVAALARDLNSRYVEAMLAQEKKTKWGDLETKLKELADERHCLDEEFERLRQAWGLSPQFDEAGTAVLAAAVRRAQESTEALHGGVAALAHVERERDNLLASLRESLSRFGYDAAADAETVSSQVEDLARREGDFKAALADCANAEALAKRLDQDIAQGEDSRRELFVHLGLEDGDEATLRARLDRRLAFLQATEELREADFAVRQAQNALGEDADLANESAETITAEQQKLRETADRWEPLNNQIIEIEALTNAAKQANDLERALAEQESARDALRQQRDKDSAAAAGHLLADFLARRERDTELPAVFRRARELFIRATHGRYRLEIDDRRDPPEFLAIDTSQQKGKRLGELSSGTRVQLLLAVRVAFVERQEQGYKLPLIFDETLGNSDERRAEQIIAAAIEFCRDGRQVFYLTAQHDEVSKWRRLLKSSGIDHREIDLAEVRRFSEADRVPAAVYEPPPLPKVPSPDGCDWLEYGRRLRPPPLDARGSTGDVHLWYLIDDVNELCRLLQMGVNKWGQLQALADVHAVDGLSDESPLMCQAAAAATVVEQAYRQWRVGRGRPVDRAALVDSQAVSDRYLDEVVQLAADQGGDAKALLAALADGKVKGFRGNKQEELQRFLLDRGYLDENDALSSDQIREIVHQAAFADIQNQSITHQRVVQLVDWVCRCASDNDGIA